MAAMSEADVAEQGREPEEPAAGGDGFPEEDVAPEEPDPDLAVDDPFGVGDEREPLEPGAGAGGGPDDADDDLED